MDDEVHKGRVRLATAAGAVLAAVALTAILLAVVAGGDGSKGTSDSAGHSTSAPSQGAAPTIPRGTDRTDRTDVNLATAYQMPTTDDPVTFGTAYVRALLTYDTTDQTFAERRTALLAWTPPNGWFTDAESMLDDFLGDQATWDAAAKVDQAQSVVINRAWVPDSVTKRMKADPAAFARTHWPYIVTVSLVRQLRGDVGSNTDLPLTVSVIVSCPPKSHCVALAPGRSVVED